MRVTRVLWLIAASLLALVSVALLTGGGALTWAHVAERDDDGYYNTGERELHSGSYALTSRAVNLDLDGWLPDGLGTARLAVERADGGAVFVGVAPRDDVDAYLAGVPHTEVVDVSTASHRVEYRDIGGSATPVPPMDAPFWTASVAGSGSQRLEWEAEEGEWRVVVMNRDGSDVVDVRATAGLRTGLLLPIGLGLLGGALVLGGVAAACTFAALRRDDRMQAVAPAVPASPRVRSPIRLRGELDPSLSRGLWLVKWFLAIPHIVVLALLWPVSVVLTVFAGVAILFTGRYPASIFDFNVGVMRWTWRVTFYAFTFGTDRYPPFSLDRDPYYAADLEIDRPGQLSRGLVLVKWWLLALPHYLIVGVFGGGFTWWVWGWAGRGDGRLFGGAGLIGLLTFIAGIALLFTRRYPQQLFDFVMGMHRWSYRVLAYAALLRDEYPPFRLDLGGRDPGEGPDAPPDVVEHPVAA